MHKAFPADGASAHRQRTGRPRSVALLAIAALASAAHATGLERVRFVVVDPSTGKPATGFVSVDDDAGHRAVLASNVLNQGQTGTIEGRTLSPALDDDATTITVPLGASVVLVQQAQLPTKEITIRVNATRLAPPNKAPAGSNSVVRDQGDIKKFTPQGQQDAKALTKGQAGVAQDSNGQAHVRGEHGDISYVVDGVPLPDTLSGRQGAVVVSSTIQTLEIITGGFAPEFGAQTAAVLNVTTLQNVATLRTDYSLVGGSYGALSGDVTSVGPLLGGKANYVLDLNGSRIRNFQEPQQPNHQDAHNFGESASGFARFRWSPTANDALSLSLSGNPADIDIPNRTGLPSSFRSSGQGFGLFGLRNADGTRPDATDSTALGAGAVVLPSQQGAGQDITERDTNDFATLAYTRRLSKVSHAQLALTILHSGQDVTNDNPSVSLGNLPVDSSIEYSPSVYRNAHNVQLSGFADDIRGAHRLKAGFVYQNQSGVETYNLVPGSQLALDALAAIAPNLAPVGTASTSLDVNGNPVYSATGSVPTVTIDRKGFYAAGYVQDTWILGRLTADYGLRLDAYEQSLNGDDAKTDALQLSPRLNFAYALEKRTQVHLSYNHLLNTPPIAQGALLGQVIKPEVLNQYDAAILRNIGHGQRVSLAYYYKQVNNQFDTALLIPGSQIGIYSTVSNQRAGVHGTEFSYDVSAPGGIGWDGYLNYSYSAARPGGLDNTGEPVPQYNDHDQRQTVGAGAAYTWRSGASAALTYELGSGLASSVVPPSAHRTPQDEFDLKLFTGNRLFHGRAGLTLDVENLFNSLKVINFQSDFSGTRFQQGRRITLGIGGKF